MKKICLVLFCGLAGIMQTHAGENWFSANGGFHSNALLPAHVVAPYGQLTLFADYSSPRDEHLPLYLVNRTSEKVVLPSQDGDLCLKLETQNASGAWQRAQGHQYSGCGNSYITISLPPGQHLVMAGYWPASGTKGTVRFATYSGYTLESNEGDGWYLPKDVEAAQYDRMSLSGAPHHLQRFIELQDYPAPRDSAISWRDRVVAMRLLHAYGGVPLVRRQCEADMAELKAVRNPTAVQAAAQQALAELSARPLKKSRDLPGFVEFCLSALDTPQGGDPVSGPCMQDARLLRGLLADMAASQRQSQVTEDSAALWTTVFLEAAAAAPNAPVDQQGEIARLLSIPALADEVLPDPVCERLLACTHSSVVDAAALALARRGRTQRLVELAWKLGPAGQVGVLRALSLDPQQPDIRGYPSEVQLSWRHPQEPGEVQFWRHCLEHHTLAAASVLIKYGQARNVAYPEWAYAAVTAWWEQRLLFDKQRGEDFDSEDPGFLEPKAVEFLAVARRHEDTPLLKSLLSYRGYSSSNFSTGIQNFVSRRFRVREEAGNALKERGQKLPQDLVTEVKLPEAATPNTRSR